MSAASSFAFLLSLLFAAGCHDDERLETGNTGASSTPSDRAQQVGTKREIPELRQPNPGAPSSGTGEGQGINARDPELGTGWQGQGATGYRQDTAGPGQSTPGQAQGTRQGKDTGKGQGASGRDRSTTGQRPR